ncbi:hypothetical protein JOQ06_013982, partial [Pogonophryne albipinna]
MRSCPVLPVFPVLLLLLLRLCSGTSFPSNIHIGGLFPSASHEYEVFRFALAQQQDIPKLVPQVDMVDTGSSFAMTYAYFIQQTWDLGKTELRAGSSKWTVARGSVQHTAA